MKDNTTNKIAIASQAILNTKTKVSSVKSKALRSSLECMINRLKTNPKTCDLDAIAEIARQIERLADMVIESQVESFSKGVRARDVAITKIVNELDFSYAKLQLYAELERHKVDDMEKQSKNAKRNFKFDTSD